MENDVESGNGTQIGMRFCGGYRRIICLYKQENNMSGKGTRNYHAIQG